MEFEGRYCKTHFEKKQRDDPAYKARYEAHSLDQAHAQEQDQEAQRIQQQAEELLRNAELAARQAAETAQATIRAQQARDRKERKNTKLINEAHLFPPNSIVAYANSLMIMLDPLVAPNGLTYIKAYALLKYRTSTHDGFPMLMRAVTRIVRQGNGHHPIHARYTDVPIAERTSAFESLQLALNAYGELTTGEISSMLPANDTHRRTIVRYLDAELRRRIEMARAAELAQLNHDLVHNPVVFRRDPEGSIDLRAFSQDGQSVHRSSVQATTQRAIYSILDRPLLDGQDTLSDIIVEFNDPVKIRWYGQNTRERAITELTNDYYNCEAFSVRYGDAIDHVWAFIKPHVHAAELVIRLAQEVCEGIGQCTNGKMARLVNVLQGYDETLEVEAPKELFQGRIARLMNHPREERESLANALFAEFHIPPEQHAIWLEPLLEV